MAFGGIFLSFNQFSNAKKTSCLNSWVLWGSSTLTRRYERMNPAREILQIQSVFRHNSHSRTDNSQILKFVINKLFCSRLEWPKVRQVIISILLKPIMKEIDVHLGLRCRFSGYQYGEIVQAMMCNFLCGGDRTENINRIRGGVGYGGVRLCCPYTALRIFSELAVDDTLYTPCFILSRPMKHFCI